MPKKNVSTTIAPAQKQDAVLIDAALLAWERELYAQDPTGGDPAKF